MAERLRFGRGPLLIGNGALARSFACAGIGMSALAAHREIAPVPKATVRPDLDQAPDVQGHFLAEVSFDPTVFLNDLADPGRFFVGQVLNFLVRTYSSAMQDGQRPPPSDTLHVSQS